MYHSTSFKTSLKSFTLGLLLVGCAVLLSGCRGMLREVSQPNILLIILEDWGLQLSCYGEPGITTPHIDNLALSGTRYTNAFCTAPVCSPSRSAMMTGHYQYLTGTHQHRTDTKYGFPKKPLPNGIYPVTYYLQKQGYFTALMNSRKTDLNFVADGSLFQGDDWSQRESGQPFFAQVTFEGTHRKWERDSINPISIDEVSVPPYYPQTDIVKRDWANGLEAMQNVDRQVGALLSRIDQEGLSENTIVILTGDNGRCMPRGKQFLYDGGLRVPLIVRQPGETDKGAVETQLVSLLDITKTMMDIIGAQPRVDLHGFNLLDGSIHTREYVFAGRDKMDSTHDASRMVRSRRYKLIHNLMPDRPYCQLNKYKEKLYPTLAEMNVEYLKGCLNPAQTRFMANHKPQYELYDLEKDPHELYNLADLPQYNQLKQQLIDTLSAWRKLVHDPGPNPAFIEGGWPATYPTRSLAEWQAHLDGFKPWVFRAPTSHMKHPYSSW